MGSIPRPDLDVDDVLTAAGRADRDTVTGTDAALWDDDDVLACTATAALFARAFADPVARMEAEVDLPGRRAPRAGTPARA